MWFYPEYDDPIAFDLFQHFYLDAFHLLIVVILRKNREQFMAEWNSTS